VESRAESDVDITLTPQAIRFLRSRAVSFLVVDVRWVEGPCQDDWCTLIPAVEVRPGSPSEVVEGDRTVFEASGIAVSLPNDLAEVAARNGDRLRIDASPIRRRLKMSGLTYALTPPSSPSRVRS
jgi:hypothetical protein